MNFPTEYPVLPGDIMAMRGRGWLSQGILKATGNTVSHVGVVTAVAPEIEITAALFRVKTQPIGVVYDSADFLCFLQDRTLKPAERRVIVEDALQFSADPYNYGAIALQLFNSLFHTTWFTDHLTLGMNGRPICSYIAADAYSRVGRNFGVKDRTTSPADIFRWAEANSDKYRILTIKGVGSYHAS